MRSKNGKKVITFILISVFLIGAILFLYNFDVMPTDKFKDLELYSKNIYVYNLTDNKKELSIDARRKVAPASLTKIMTCLVALENIDDLSAIAPIDKDTYQKMVRENSSMAGFYGNEQTTYRDLLYGTILASGGECANSLAVNVSGDVSTFVSLMNEKAKEIGLKNTTFKNPDGLDEKNHYSTAEDLSRLLKYSLNNANFRAIFTRETYTSKPTIDHSKGIVIKSTVLEKLHGYNQNGFKILGGKSGTTKEAGHCWATLVEKNGKQYICIVMGSPIRDNKTNDEHILDTLNIMEKI